MKSSLITSDDSMVISSNPTIDESLTTRKNISLTRRRGRKLGLSDISTPIYQNMNEESSLMTSDMSQVTEISTRNESSDSMLGERSQEEDNMEKSTLNKSPDLLLGEQSQQTSRSVTRNQNKTSESMQNQNNNPQTAGTSSSESL